MAVSPEEHERVVAELGEAKAELGEAKVRIGQLEQLRTYDESNGLRAERQAGVALVRLVADVSARTADLVE